MSLSSGGLLGVPVVVDNGSGRIKGGYAGYDVPHCIFSSVVGHPKHLTSVLGCPTTFEQQSAVYVGDDAQKRRGILQLQYPIQHGRIVNFDAMERIWTYVFKQKLKTDPELHPLLVTDTPLSSYKTRHETLERLFEGLRVPAASIRTQHALALYALGRTTGLVYDCGESGSYAATIYEGFAIDRAMERQFHGVSGQDLTNYLGTLLLNEGYLVDNNFSWHHASAELEIIRDIKEKLCYVSQDLSAELKHCNASKTPGRNYELPDGNILEVTTPLFECPEALFQPKLLATSTDRLGIHELLYRRITAADIDLRRELAQAVILTGGSTLFPGLKERIGQELSRMCPKHTTVKIIAPPEREYITWTGASILASLSAFHTQWITRDTFDDMGPYVLARTLVS